MVQTLVKPVNFQFDLTAGSKGASSPRVKGMHGERRVLRNAFTIELG